MKLTTSILFLLLACNVYGQKWKFIGIDKSSKFKYQYRFQFDNLDDTSSFYFEKYTGDSKTSIRLADNKGDTVVYATIRIKGLDNDTLLYITYEPERINAVKVNPGKYRIEVLPMGYSSFSFDFAISEGEYFDLNIKLGLRSELTIYQINSKNELTEQEIQAIMKCVKLNGQDYHIKCLDKKRYIIWIQI